MAIKYKKGEDRMLITGSGRVAIPKDKIAYVERGTFYNHLGEKHYRVNVHLINCAGAIEMARYKNIEDAKKEMQRIIEWLAMGKIYKPKGDEYNKI